MKAVIKTGGKQYLVSKDDVLSIEKIKDAKENDEIIFDNVLLTYNDDKINLGNPIAEKAEVKAKILEIKKGKKLTIRKYKNKTRYHKKIGHRQIKAKVQILSIK